MKKEPNDRSKLRPVIPEDVYFSVRDKFHNVCFNCGSQEKLQIDHHRAKVNGGDDCIKNYVLLCAKCNGMSGKGVKTPEEFYTAEQLTVLKEEYGIY